MGAKTLSSPTARLLMGLAITLAAVAVFSLYALRQIAMLKDLQARTVERSRKDSLQLLRIQNDLHSLGLAMRDMVDGNEPYPLEAWRGQFSRTREDLDDALRIEAQLAPETRGPRRHYISNALAQFWISAERLFAMAGSGGAGPTAQARMFIRTSLEAQQAALTDAVARALVENNIAEQQAAAQIQGIYERVERQTYYFLAAVLVAISLTSLYTIRSSRMIFDRLAVLSGHRSELARKLNSSIPFRASCTTSSARSSPPSAPC